MRPALNTNANTVVISALQARTYHFSPMAGCQSLLLCSQLRQKSGLATRR